MARSKRLNLLASLTQGYDTVLDIGTDHGLVLKKAIDLGFINHAIAADIKDMPLNAAKENLKGYPVKFIVSDGFKSIDQSFDLAIIAGMGAYTICEILDHAPDDDIMYVLQPNDKHEILRSYLSEHGFIITDEEIIHDGFYYIVMIARRGDMALSEKDAYLGPILQHKKTAKPYYKNKLKILTHILKQADESKKQAIKTLMSYLKSVL